MSGTRGSPSKASTASALDRTMSIDRQRRASRASAPVPAVWAVSICGSSADRAWTMSLDQTIAIWSGFGGVGVPPEEGQPVSPRRPCHGHLGDLETGLPGAEGIDYWLLSSQSPFTTWIVGGEWYLHPAVRFSPNLEMVRYANEPDPVNYSGQTPGLQVRFTFFWTF